MNYSIDCTFFFLFFFLSPIALRETKKPNLFLILHVLSRVSNVIDRRQRRKRRKNKEYDQTRSVFYVRCNS